MKKADRHVVNTDLVGSPVREKVSLGGFSTLRSDRSSGIGLCSSYCKCVNELEYLHAASEKELKQSKANIFAAHVN